MERDPGIYNWVVNVIEDAFFWSDNNPGMLGGREKVKPGCFPELRLFGAAVRRFKERLMPRCDGPVAKMRHRANRQCGWS